MALLDWLRKTTTAVLDPRRADRHARWASAIEDAIRLQRGSFKFDQEASALAIPVADWTHVGLGVYRRALERVWRDFSLTSREKAALEDLRVRLLLEKRSAEDAFYDFTRRRFAEYFTQAMSSGRISDREIATLKHIAEEIGSDLGIAVRSLVAAESKAFLRDIFFAIVENSRLDEHSWRNLVNACSRLGLSETYLVHAIAAQRHELIERTLAEAKTDSRISGNEAKYLRWLLQVLQPETKFRAYVEAELEELELLTGVADGKLPSIKSSALLLRGGELVHFEESGVFVRIRKLASGPREDRFRGVFTITDLRLVLTSSEMCLDVGLSRILSVQPVSGGVRVHTTGKGSGFYHFENAKVGIAVLDCAIRRANQTLGGRSVAGTDRHIPRDVRQRVWARYGGRCAECSAENYLEFDHVVPVAKGGSNSENNVQLLCRACNMKKSDRL